LPSKPVEIEVQDFSPLARNDRCSSSPAARNDSGSSRLWPEMTGVYLTGSASPTPPPLKADTGVPRKSQDFLGQGALPLPLLGRGAPRGGRPRGRRLCGLFLFSSASLSLAAASLSASTAPTPLPLPPLGRGETNKFIGCFRWLAFPRKTSITAPFLPNRGKGWDRGRARQACFVNYL